MNDDELEVKVRDWFVLRGSPMDLGMANALCARWLAQREALRRVEELHMEGMTNRWLVIHFREIKATGFCRGCHQRWPCHTVRALKGET